MEDGIILGGIGAVPIITALVQVVRTAVPALPSRFIPLSTLAAGMGWQNAYALASGEWEAMTLLLSVTIGLAATGLYEATSRTLGLNSGGAA